MVAVDGVAVAPVSVMLFAPRVSVEVSVGADHDVYGSDIEKSAAAPEELATIERAEPDESLTTVAVTPKLAALIEVARSFRLAPAAPLAVPVWNVWELPAVVVNVKDPAGSVEMALGWKAEYHDPVEAVELTSTVWLPRVVPAAAVAVTALLSEVATVRADSGPVREFSDSKSVLTACVAV
jgi:hypothetical protein